MLLLAEKLSYLTRYESIHPSTFATKLPQILKSESTNRGIIVAFIIIGIWAISLVFLFSLIYQSQSSMAIATYTFGRRSFILVHYCS